MCFCKAGANPRSSTRAMIPRAHPNASSDLQGKKLSALAECYDRHRANGDRAPAACSAFGRSPTLRKTLHLKRKTLAPLRNGLHKLRTDLHFSLDPP